MAAENSDFSPYQDNDSYLFDWGIREAFLADPRAHSITIYNGGNTPFSFTKLSAIAKADRCRNPIISGATKNRSIYIHDANITQTQLIRIAEEADGVE